MIELSRDQDGRLRVTGSGHERHENAERMPFVCDFVRDRVLPLVDPDVNVTGRYRIELHDSYSYLPSHYTARHRNAMVFARPRGATESVALIPDTFHMGDFGGMLRVRDTIGWDTKYPVMFFAGSTTGDRDPERNERIRACVWSLQHRDVARFHVTNVVQMCPRDALAKVPAMARTLHPHISVADHFQYKYQVNIAGNTACWSRVPMIMASSCIMLNMDHSDILWYYPLLADGTHYVGASSLDDLLKQRQYCVANDAWCRGIVAHANRFAKSFFESSTAAGYMAQLLEHAALSSRP